MRYERILAAVASDPWMIEPGKGQAIAAFLSRKAAGETIPAAEVEAVSAAARDRKQKGRPRSGSVALIPLLKTGFIPPDDNSQTQVYLSLAPGATLAQTSATAETARQRLMQLAHVRSVYTTVGGGSAGGPGDLPGQHSPTPGPDFRGDGGAA